MRALKSDQKIYRRRLGGGTRASNGLAKTLYTKTRLHERVMGNKYAVDDFDVDLSPD